MYVNFTRPGVQRSNTCTARLVNKWPIHARAQLVNKWPAETKCLTKSLPENHVSKQSPANKA